MRRALLIASLLAIPAIALAGTINRGTKPDGSTDWADGDTLTHSALNTDFNTIYNLVNGNLDTDNLDSAAGIVSGQILDGTLVNADINASAAIVYSKFAQTANAQDADIVDDYAASDAEYITEADPGDSSSISKPTNLEEELARLRFVIDAMAHGTNAAITDGSSDVAWFDQNVVGAAFGYNLDFEAQTGGAGTAPDGWALVEDSGTITTVAQTETAVALGEGKEIHIVAQANKAQGISQTFAGLKASTNYLVSVYAKAATGSDECQLVTTGATGTFDNLALVTSSTSYTQLAGVIATDSTPTDIVVKLLSNSDAQADDCDYDRFSIRPLGDDQSDLARLLVLYDTSTTAQSFSGTMAARTDLDNIAVTPPGPGYIITVTLDANFELNATPSACEADITENGSAVRTTSGTGISSGDAHNITLNLHYVNTSPTPGTTYTYVGRGRQLQGACAADGGDEEWALTVRMERAG